MNSQGLDFLWFALNGFVVTRASWRFSSLSHYEELLLQSLPWEEGSAESE